MRWIHTSPLPRGDLLGLDSVLQILLGERLHGYRFVAGLAGVGVHIEQLLQNDGGGSRRRFRSGDIGAKCAVPTFKS